MLRPVGPQPPSVYWRRRLMLLAGIAGIIVLLVITISTAFGSDGSTQVGAGAAPTTSPPPTGSPTSVHTSTPRTSTPTTTARSASSTGSASATAMPKACVPANLQVAAVVGKSTYAVGAKPLVELQVTNTGSAPCVQDMADKQIQLTVYNGTSRVWGSHDCAVQPGTDPRTLAVGQPYLYGVQWEGLTSEVGCKQAVRQRIGAGTYTLYASLAGKTGTSTQFTIS